MDFLIHRFFKHSVFQAGIASSVFFTKISALMFCLFVVCSCRSIDLKHGYAGFPVKQFDQIGLEISLPTNDVYYRCYSDCLYLSMKKIPTAWFSFGEPRTAVGLTVDRISGNKYNEKIGIAKSRAFDSYKVWDSEQHLSVSFFGDTNGSHFFRYDVLCPNGDYLVVSAAIFPNILTPEEIETVGKIVGSVKPLR